jgi:hypothetical protein
MNRSDGHSDVGPPNPAHEELFDLSGAFGDFELIDLAGRDGPFALYRARQTTLGRLVTLKVLVEGPATIERTGLLRHEAEEANRLDHSGVIRVFEVGSRGGIPFLVMTSIDGELLAERLKFGPLPSMLAVDLVRQLAETLAHAHEKGVTHGGLRPGAIWITADRQIRLGGFGQLIQYDAADLDALCSFAGYLAPEQAGLRGVVGKHTDLYGMGAILYAMLTGRPPHQGPTVEATFQSIRHESPIEPSRIVHTVEPELDVICSKCLNPTPARRYGVERPLQRFIADLRRFQSGKPIRGDQIRLRDFARSYFRRKRRVLVAAALILVGVSMPAIWDGHRRRSAWQAIATADVQSTEFTRAMRYFEERRLDRPNDSEMTTALAFARCRTRHFDEASQILMPARGELDLSLIDDDWATVRKLIRLEIALNQGRWTEALPAIQGGSEKQIAPRTAVEWQLFLECRRLLEEESALLAAIRRGDRAALRIAAQRPPSDALIRAVADKLAQSDEVETRIRCIWVLSRFGRSAAACEQTLVRLASEFRVVELRFPANDPVLSWLGNRPRILFCIAPIKALDAIDPEWTRTGDVRGIVPDLIELLAQQPDPSGVQDSVAEVLRTLGRIDSNWMISAVARAHRSAWESWTRLNSPWLQAAGAQILQRLDAQKQGK